VSKRIMQVIILIGILSIPTFASADSGIFETPVNTTSPVEPIAEEVTGTTTQLLNEPEQPVTKTVDAVKVISEKVAETIEVEKPLNLTREPSIKANTGVIEVDVSEKPLVKVDTTVAKVEVSEPLDVEVDTEVVKTEVSIVPPPLTSNKKPLVERAEEQEPRAQPQSINKNEISVKDQVILEPPIDDKPTDTVDKSPIPLKENEFDPLIAIPPIQSGPYNQLNSSSGHVNMAMAVLESVNHEYANGFFTYFGRGRTFFDQWLNAPPSQPPQNSLFTISRI